MLPIKLLSVLAVVVLSGCMTPPTVSSRPNAYLPVFDGKFRAADEALMVDCIFDGFLDSQTAPGSTLVGQLRRANGYRVTLTYGPTQFLDAEIRRDGELVVKRLENTTFFNIEKELIVAKDCLAKYAAPAN